MILPSLPGEAAPLLLALAPAFTRPSGQRFLLLMAAAVLTTGRRTVANLLRTLGPLAQGHPTTYQRVLSSASWSGRPKRKSSAGSGSTRVPNSRSQKANASPKFLCQWCRATL